MSRIIWIWLALAVTAAGLLPGRGTERDLRLELEYKIPRLYLESPEEPTSLWETFEFAASRSTATVFGDRFHPLITSQWQLHFAHLDTEAYREYPTHQARRALARSVATGLREAAFDLPFVQWLDGRRGFFVDLLLNSVDAVEEEELAPLDPAFRAVERTWWNRLADNKNFSFGLRPFRTSPYAFMSASFWRGDSLLMLTHVRYHYENFADHKLEVAVSLPLGSGYAIDAGTAYQFDRHEDSRRMVLKLSRQFRNGGVMHVGMEAQEHPTFVVGLAMPL